MKTIIFVLTVLLSIALNYQSTNAQWVQRYSSPGYTSGSSIAIDNAGNTYVACSSSQSDYLSDYLTIKYNSSGIQQWAKVYNGPQNNNDVPYYMVSDSTGNVYVTGRSEEDMLTIKYNSSGDSLWVRRYNETPNLYAYGSSIAVDNSGNVYVTGSVQTTISHMDFITLKYNSSGDILWVRKFNGLANRSDLASLLNIDEAGNVYVAGETWGLANEKDILTVKYNSAGDQQWFQRYTGAGSFDDIPTSMGLDGSGNVIVTGVSYSTQTNDDYVTIKYNSNGDSLWVKKYNGPANNVDAAYSIAIGKSGNVYVTGSSVGITSGSDYATIKYNSSGVQKWIKRYHNVSDDAAVAIGIDAAENIYVTGYSSRFYLYDYATVKYDSSSNQKSVQRYIDPFNVSAYPRSMKIDSIGNVYVIGVSDIWNHGQSLTIKYSQFPARSLYLSVLVEGLFNNLTNRMVRDTVIVYLRDSQSPYPLVDSSVSVLDSNGNGFFNFPLTLNGVEYYIIVRHRNSIETWSMQPKIFTNNQLSYDFTTAANMAYGNNLVLKGSEYCIYSGDVNRDGLIDVTDLNHIYNDVINNVTGYLKTDLNGDGFTDVSDLTISFNNSRNFIMIVSP